MYHQILAGLHMHCHLEQPSGSDMLRQPALQPLIEQTVGSSFDMCASGLKHPTLPFFSRSVRLFVRRVKVSRRFWMSCNARRIIVMNRLLAESKIIRGKSGRLHLLHHIRHSLPKQLLHMSWHRAGKNRGLRPIWLTPRKELSVMWLFQIIQLYFSTCLTACTA